MEWNGVAGALVLGLSSLAVISLLFWVGHAVLNFLGDDIPVRRRSSSGNGVVAAVSPGPDPKPLQERGETPAAIQEEREKINEIVGKPDRLTVDALGKPSL